MTYKLKQVQNTDEIEKRMRGNVLQQLNKPKRKKIIHIPKEGEKLFENLRQK